MTRTTRMTSGWETAVLLYGERTPVFTPLHPWLVQVPVNCEVQLLLDRKSSAEAHSSQLYKYRFIVKLLRWWAESQKNRPCWQDVTARQAGRMEQLEIKPRHPTKLRFRELELGPCVTMSVNWTKKMGAYSQSCFITMHSSGPWLWLAEPTFKPIVICSINTHL